MVAFGQREAHLLFRLRIEKDQAGRLGFHHLAAEQLAIHPEAQHHRFGVRRAFPGQREAHGVLAVEIDAVTGFDGAGVHPPDTLVAAGVFHREGFGQGIGRHRARGDPLGGRQVLLHEHGRDGQDVADVVEALAGIVGGEVLLRAKLHAQQVAYGVGVLVPVQAVGRDPAGVGLGIAVRLGEFTLDVFHQRVDFRLRAGARLWAASPRHGVFAESAPRLPGCRPGIADPGTPRHQSRRTPTGCCGTRSRCCPEPERRPSGKSERQTREPPPAAGTPALLKLSPPSRQPRRRQKPSCFLDAYPSL